MDLEREILLNRLVEQALDQPDDRRREFLRQAVDGDWELLEEVWQLLQDLEETDEFLEEPLVRAVGDQVSLLAGSGGLQLPFEESGPLQIDQIGPYHLVRPLGAGGMGRVYLAEQHHPVRRQVALKLIRSSVRGPEAQARFDAERQALARLDHPNIGRLLDADTTSFGLQYFVMELVDGEPLHAYCDQKNLGVRERLGLFRDVCLGVQHAHGRQVLHRDLKPSNILVATVDGAPVPKIIDFGIAKTLDEEPADTSAATLGRVLGTPVYMSPEALDQVDGSADLDERSDVYSLGILLYELISGLRPFETDGQGLAHLLREIAHREPPSPAARLAAASIERRSLLASRRRTDPAALRRALAGDLEWVVMKAVAKHRDHRYDSAAELGEDVGRYLRGERVQAGPPRIFRDVVRFGRRRARALSTAALALALAAAVAWGASIHRERGEAREELAALKQRLDAERLAGDRLVYSVGRFLETAGPPSETDLVDVTRALTAPSGTGAAGRLELLVVLAESLGPTEAARELAGRALALCRENLGSEDPVTRRAERLVEELCPRENCEPTHFAPAGRKLRRGSKP